MTARTADPLRLDVAAFANEGAVLEGQWPLAGFERLVPSLVTGHGAPADPVHWQARGERRVRRGGEAQTWLHLHADAHVNLECQRCLNAVRLPIEVARSFLFIPGEEAAAQLDVDSEDDVLPLKRSLNLHELVEDELLLALPIVPLHEVCPEPLPMPLPIGDVVDDAVAEDKPMPFAALAALKRNRLN